MSHKNDLSACIKWRAGNANGGRLEEESPQLGPAWLCLPRAENCQTAHLGSKAVARGGRVVFWADCPAALAGRSGSNRGRCLIFMPNPVGINWRTRELRVENLQCVI